MGKTSFYIASATLSLLGLKKNFLSVMTLAWDSWLSTPGCPLFAFKIQSENAGIQREIGGLFLNVIEESCFNPIISNCHTPALQTDPTLTAPWNWVYDLPTFNSRVFFHLYRFGFGFVLFCFILWGSREACMEKDFRIRKQPNMKCYWEKHCPWFQLFTSGCLDLLKAWSIDPITNC